MASIEVSDLGVAKVVIGFLATICGLLGGLVIFFLKRIYDKFVELVGNVGRIERNVETALGDIATLWKATFEVDRERSNGNKPHVKRTRGGGGPIGERDDK